jgi:hypothetical protein
MAAVMACGQGAVLSHFDAAALWKIYKGAGARVHVTRTTNSGRRLDGVQVHRARRLHSDDVTVKDRIPVTTVARTLVDLTDVLGSDRILRAIREAEFLQLLDIETLNAAVQRAHGRKRLGVLKQALAHHTPGQIVREELEHRFLELIRAAGLPDPETNVKVRTRRRTYEIDYLWRDQRVAVELDGRAAPREQPPSSRTGARTQPSMQSACAPPLHVVARNNRPRRRHRRVGDNPRAGHHRAQRVTGGIRLMPRLPGLPCSSNQLIRARGSGGLTETE